MDKDIIIDEVNVAECEHRNDTHNTLLADGAIKKFSNYCYITNDGCYGVNCYYKQLKRLQAENEENIKRLRELSKEERELREGWHAQCEVIEVLREENKRLQAENKRLQHQNEIQNYKEKISSLENEIKKIQNEKQEINKKMGTVISMSSESMKEMDHLRILLNDYKKDREQANISLNSYIEKNNKLIQENKAYKQAILKHEEDSGKMAQKLAELKNLMIKLNLKNRMFHVKKVGLLSYTEIDILFGKSDEGNYIMRIDDQNEREVINILDVESVEIQKGTNDKVEIVYMKDGKKLSMVVIVDELIIDQIVKAYKIFFSESMKQLNDIDY